MPRYKIHHFKSLTSTQDKAKEFAKKGLSNIVILADIQTKGRGRFKRKWHSDKGGLWFSILINPKHIERPQYLTFIAAVAVAITIKKTGINAKIKWPNDIHFNDRKICGILTEGILGKENYFSIGIGVNINQKTFPKEIKTTATSLRILKNKNFDKNNIMEEILNKFFRLYNDFYNKNKFHEIIKLWKQSSDTIGKQVIVMTHQKKIIGKAIDIDDDCNLIIESNNKKIRIIEGDVTVRY